MSNYFLRPSAAPIWGHCSGAPAAMADHPAIDTPATLEGTAAHWVCSQTLSVWRDLHAPANCAMFLDAIAPNGVVIDDKIVEGAQVFVDEVLAVVPEDGRARLFIESGMQIASIHLTENGGTPDAWYYDPAVPYLWLWDYKHGHRYCPAQDNLQLINYVAGIIEKLAIAGDRDSYWRATLSIVQPFCYVAPDQVDRWVVRLSDLRAHVNRLWYKAQEATIAPTLTPGTHCRDCSAAVPCRANRLRVGEITEYADSPFVMDALTGDDLAIERGVLQDAKKLLDSRLEAIEDELKHRLQNGDACGSLCVQTEYGRNNWTVPPEQAIALASQFEADISKVAVLTPTQAVKAVKPELRDGFQAVIKQVTGRKPSGLKLTQRENSRSALAFKKPQQ